MQCAHVPKKPLVAEAWKQCDADHIKARICRLARYADVALVTTLLSNCHILVDKMHICLVPPPARAPIGNSSQRGSTVLEAMMAFVIVLIALPGLGSVTSLGAVKTNANEVQAVAAGQQYLDQLRDFIRTHDSSAALPTPPTITIDQGQSFVSGGSTAPIGSFTITSDGCPILASSFGLIRNCSVSVTWTDAGKSKSRTLVSYATQQF